MPSSEVGKAGGKTIEIVSNTSPVGGAIEG
jgi:hypothetical protein